MKKAAIAIDNWKLSIFKKHLDAAGYNYTEHPGLTQDTLVLRVNYEQITDLQPVVEAANAACATAGGAR